MRTRLRSGETLLLQTRIHWLTMVVPTLITLLPLALFTAAFFIPWGQTDPQVQKIVRLALGGLALVTLIWFLIREFGRRCNLWAVTNLRVIDEDGIFSHSSKESPLEKINNTSYHQSLLGRIFNYGDIEIQTAAEEGATIYHMIHAPRLLKDTIATACDQHRMRMARVEGGKSVEGLEGEPTRECPFCAELIKARAKICRYCNRELPPVTP
jgi:uncharacterized membrane protein YdbT with pleckstrin-like domain